MNILLIGGAGNISAACAEEFIRLGHRVHAVTRGIKPLPQGVHQLTADRRDAGSLKAALGTTGIDAAVDFLGFSPDDIKTDLEVLAGRVSQLIFVSSATVYRKPHTSLPITEEHPLGNPYSEYARKKQACEELLLKQDAVPVTIVRPSHTFSKKWAPNCVSSAGYTFIDRLERSLPVFVPGDGSNPWTITAASDFARGICGLAGNSSAIGETFNITSDEHPTWKEIYMMTADAAGTGDPDIDEVPVDFICSRFPNLEANIRGDKCQPAVFDNSKIKTLVPSFKCTKTFRQAIGEAVDWMRSHPEDKVIRNSVHETFDSVTTAWRRRSQS